MSPERALALAREIARTDGFVKPYCARLGIPVTTLMSQALRAGVRLGTAVRVERLAMADEAKAAGVRWWDVAIRAGYSSPQALWRARHRSSHVVAAGDSA